MRAGARDRRARQPARVAGAVEPLAVLHGDRAERRERRGLAAACARSGTGCSRTRSHSPAPSGPGLSQIAFETPSRPRPWTSAGAAQRAHLVLRQPEPAPPASAASSATACAWPSVYGDLRSTKSAIASSAASTARRTSTTASAGSASITASHVATASSPREHLRLVAERAPRQRRVELLRRRARRASSLAASTPPDAVRHLDELRELGDPRGERDRRRPRARPASPCRPTARRRAPSASSTASGSPSSRRRAPAPSPRGGRSSRRPRGGPRRANSSPIRKRCSGGLPGAEEPQPGDAARTLRSSWSYLRRLQRDVVAEPLRLLVGVGVAADVDQQRRVVDGDALLLVEARRSASRSAIRHWRRTCSIGWPKPRSMPSESAATSSASRTCVRSAIGRA